MFNCQLKNLLLYLSFNFLLFSCRINYENIAVLEDVPDEIPIIEISNARYNGVENFKLTNYLEVEEMKIYQSPEIVRIFRGRFLNFPDGERLDLSGNVNSARYDRSTEDALVDEQIFIKSEKNGISISTEGVRWINETRVFESLDDKEVTIRKDDGSWLTGRGLVIDMNDRTVKYTQAVRGQLNVS